MDTKEKTQLDSTVLDQLETTLESTLTITPPLDPYNTHHYPGFDMSGIISGAASDTITISSLDSLTFGPSYTNIDPYTISTSLPSNSAWTNSGSSSGQITLNGDNADIVVNGVSLMDLLKDRLNIMIPDPKLEAEWDQLKLLGDQYRELEKKLREQGDMWAKLKAMPPPETL